jgi:hypothetical protein
MEVTKPRTFGNSISAGAPDLWAQANGSVPVIEDTTDNLKGTTHHGMSE